MKRLGDGVALTALREHNLNYSSLWGFVMLKKLLKQVKPSVTNEAADELVEILNEIDEKQRKIAEKKEKAKEEWQDGARATKHRFTI
ncbi:hypothetical protein [Klebsiella aerogenes]|uniref:hypothetical protein n=1 Tax=Klebsiella aerogenes TaxID=548 RepID=UPI0037525095